jgi:hypothetical protein
MEGVALANTRGIAGAGRGEMGANEHARTLVASLVDGRKASGAEASADFALSRAIVVSIHGPDRRPSVTVYRKEVNSGCCCEREGESLLAWE